MALFNTIYPEPYILAGQIVALISLVTERIIAQTKDELYLTNKNSKEIGWFVHDFKFENNSS